MSVCRQRGVTLLELLVAVAIFALIGVAAYTALFSVLDAREATERQSERLAAVQYAVGALVSDLEQVVNRPVRSIQAAQRLPVVAQPGAGPALAVTRGGWFNPAGLPRSTLVRAQWSLDGNRLVRSWRGRPDALAGVEPERRVLLERVDAIDFRFQDGAGEWHDSWPPLNANPADVGLPRAVELSLQLPDWGEIRRLVALPQGPPPTLGGAGGGAQG